MILDVLPGGYVVLAAFIIFGVLAALATFVAVLHPRQQRRNDAIRVLTLLLSVFRRNGGAQ